jgi:hypothetical protein
MRLDPSSYRYAIPLPHPHLHSDWCYILWRGFANLEKNTKDRIVDELLEQGVAVFGEVMKSRW